MVDDDVVAVSGIPTLLLTMLEVEALLLGPEGTTCVLQLSSPRFPDSVRCGKKSHISPIKSPNLGRSLPRSF